jgi:acetylornithine deacetylase
MLDVLADLRAARWPRDEFFGETTCNIGTVNGGTRPNIIPAAAEAELQIRLVTPSAAVKALLEETVAGRARVEYLSVAEPVRMHPVEGFEREVVRFTTDIPYLPHWGAPLLVGPGSILDAHTDGERVSKRELEEAVEIYTRLARTLLAGSGRDVQTQGAGE